ncbi:MAG: Transposase zinc-ribbon domain protein [Chlamydiales bacterium]|jgi:transposase-like protein|nr:Transposase zinc-ribbon domain protein [Chlamydiales bacterium]
MTELFTMFKIQSIIDDEKCYEEVRNLRWPNGASCTSCDSLDIVKNGHHETNDYRQRYLCKSCGKRFDDLTNTIFEGHHQPLKVWIITLYFMGLNLANKQIAQELELCESDVQDMTELLHQGIVDRKSEPKLSGDVEIDEVYIVAGHKGNSDAVKKKAVKEDVEA